MAMELLEVLYGSYPLKDQGAFRGSISFLGRYLWLEIFMFWAQILIEVVDEKYLSCPPNFRTFGDINKKLWPNI